MSGDNDSPGKRLRWARERLGVDQVTFAKAVDVKPVTYRAYENDQNGFAKRAPDFARLLGVPTDWLLSGGPRPAAPPPALPEPNAILAPPMEGASDQRMLDDVPVYGTALGAPKVVDGEAIEQTYLNSGEAIHYARRPVILNGRADVYGLYIVGSSMYPRHEEGELVYVETKRPARPGDDVVLYLRMPDGDGERDGSVLIKRLVRTTGQYVELEQFSPQKVFQIPREKVSKVHRVLTFTDMVS